MAALISKASGNLSASTTWFLVDATSLLDSEAGNTELTTSYVESASFTPGAITIDGIAVKLASRAASPTGTVSVRLALGGATVSGTEVTINATDLPTCATASNEGGWILFKFASPVTLAAATAYTVSAKESVATADIFLYRNATAGNWSRMLRTTTEQAPAAGDQLDVMGEHTGAGTGNNFTVTNDLTATTDFGSGSDGAVAVTVSKRGTLSFGTTAATNYYLKCSGNVIVYNGGEFDMGTTGTPIPRDSTAVLEFDPVADGGMGLYVRNGGIFNAQGLSRTSGKNVYYCKLNTDEAAAQTVLGVDTDTGWLNGDEIAIASTSQTSTQSENRTLSGGASATELTVSAGLTYAHSGTAPTQAEIILLTRNVKIRSASSSIMTFIYLGTATVDMDWVEMYYMGENATNKHGLNIVTADGGNIQYCSLHDFEDWGVEIFYNAAGGVTFSKNVLNKIKLTASAASGLYTFKNSNFNTVAIDDNIFIYCGNTGASDYYESIVWLTSVPESYQRNIIAGCQVLNGSFDFPIFSLASSGSTGITTSADTMKDNVIHSCNQTAWGRAGSASFTDYLSGSMGALTIWRCAAAGLYFSFDSSNLRFDDYTIKNLTIFGCSTYSFYIGGSGFGGSVLTLDNFQSSGDTTFATTNGIYLSADADLRMYSCKFSEAGGIRAVHTNDINITYTSPGYRKTRIIMDNCLLNGTNDIVNYDKTIYTDKRFQFMKSQNHQQTAGNHKSWWRYGIIQSDTSIYRTASPSVKMTPNSASGKLESGGFKVNVNSGQTCTPSVYVRESVVGDGTDYNGSRIRLILKRNDALGITADVVIDTATVSSEGAFEQLTGTTAAASADGVMEFVIDCAGTTGWVNFDDFSATVA